MESGKIATILKNMILNIQKGQTNPILRQKAEEIKEITGEIKQLALNMVKTMEKNQGIGLAAPQVGKLMQIITVKPDIEKKALILINPKIKKTSRKKDVMLEGCLSLPGVNLPVERPVKITVQGLDINGEKIKIKAKELLARVIEHEIDHLNGILITDKIYEEK